MGDSFELKKIDVDQNMDLAQKYGIQVVPTLIIEKDGKVIHQLEGVTGAETLEGYLKPLL
jgi:thioredoxin 1